LTPWAAAENKGFKDHSYDVVVFISMQSPHFASFGKDDLDFLDVLDGHTFEKEIERRRQQW